MNKRIKELLKEYDDSKHSLDQKAIATKIVAELKRSEKTKPRSSIVKDYLTTHLLLKLCKKK